jgi:hypothetical protein
MTEIVQANTEVIFSEKNIEFTPAMAQGALSIIKQKDGTIVLSWQEDWNTELQEDTITLNSEGGLTHIRYFENNNTFGTLDIGATDTRLTLQNVFSYLDTDKDGKALDIIRELIKNLI